jgi:hypothetical protein
MRNIHVAARLLLKQKTALGCGWNSLFATGALPGLHAVRRSGDRQGLTRVPEIIFGRRLVKYQLPGRSTRFKLLKLFF